LRDGYVPFPPPPAPPIMTQSPDVLNLSVPATRDRIAAARASLRSWLKLRQVPPLLIDDVLLAASEALTNAAEHGHAFDGSLVEVTLGVVEGGLWLTVTDTGAWGSPHAMADRGRGIAIIRAVSQEVAIETTAAGTTVRVLFGLPVDSAV
jgi:anti-sigma regulatory factor (Ser/Thr protein kinase)